MIGVYIKVFNEHGGKSNWKTQIQSNILKLRVTSTWCFVNNKLNWKPFGNQTHLKSKR